MTLSTKKQQRAQAPHAPLPFSGGDTGVLLIGGQGADALADTHGTPLFAYDETIITQTFDALRAALPAAVDIHYAVKANPYGPVVEHLAGRVNGLDVASVGELRAVRALVGAHKRISFAGPGKRDDELAAAIELDAIVNLESKGELERLAGIARAKGIKAKAAIRVNPPFELKGSGMRMGGGPKQFGIDDDQVPDLLRAWPSDTLDFQGFHIFTGSQGLSVGALQEAHANALALALDLAKYAPCKPKLINIGGGIGVPYFPGDEAVDVAAVGQGLAETLERFGPDLNDASVIMELGRYLVAEAGVYLTRIVDKKVSRGTTFLITDGGLHHQLAVSGNFGQVFRKNYPVAIANRFDDPSATTQSVNVVGCLCTPLDRLGDNVALPDAQVGDVFAVFRCGAYGPTASPSTFLGHPEAKEVLI